MDNKETNQSALPAMEDLVKKLNEAAKAYYSEDHEIMSNADYDQFYDQLETMEKETGIVLAGSPTQKVGYQVMSKLQKDRHAEPALSLNKTKDRGFVGPWLDGHEGVMSWKLDGLTIVATYDYGALTKAVTRGNGEIGEIVTHNARYFHGLPQRIPYMGHMVVRGEAFITYSEFERINEEIPDTDARYKNPRNLASGTVRQLDSQIAASRNVQFRAFELVELADNSGTADTMESIGLNRNSFLNRFTFLEKQGFGVVEHVKVNADNQDTVIDEFEAKVSINDFPSDGLVIMYDDIQYSKSLGTTGKYPRYGMAFKWADEMAETTLQRVEWNASRTGLINPVAVFDTVELEGTEVSRATAHNISIYRKLHLSPGSRIRVYKANMIIPTIFDNVAPAEWQDELCGVPTNCPVCGSKTEVYFSPDGVETLYCRNEACPAKHVKSYAHFARRDSMNIENLNEATLQKLIDAGLVHSLQDLYHLSEHEAEIADLEGMGEKSARGLVEAVERSRDTTFARFLSGLGIPLIGRSASKEIAKSFSGDFYRFMDEWRTEGEAVFADTPDVGEKMAASLSEYLALYEDEIISLASELRFQKEEVSGNVTLIGKTFVITGAVHHFPNRDALKAEIEKLGGKVSGSVSSKTSYLINNDTASTSGKNKKAKELGIPIISEDEFLAMT